MRASGWWRRLVERLWRSCAGPYRDASSDSPVQSGLNVGSAGPFEDYVEIGMGKAPLVMIYESQFIEYALAQKDVWFARRCDIRGLEGKRFISIGLGDLDAAIPVAMLDVGAPEDHEARFEFLLVGQKRHGRGVVPVQELCKLFD